MGWEEDARTALAKDSGALKVVAMAIHDGVHHDLRRDRAHEPGQRAVLPGGGGRGFHGKGLWGGAVQQQFEIKNCLVPCFTFNLCFVHTWENMIGPTVGFF
jgi:hypothetical protein